jgi:hypothetical protein
MSSFQTAQGILLREVAQQEAHFDPVEIPENPGKSPK